MNEQAKEQERHRELFEEAVSRIMEADDYGMSALTRITGTSPPEGFMAKEGILKAEGLLVTALGVFNSLVGSLSHSQDKEVRDLVRDVHSRAAGSIRRMFPQPAISRGDVTATLKKIFGEDAVHTATGVIREDGTMEIVPDDEPETCRGCEDCDCETPKKGVH